MVKKEDKEKIEVVALPTCELRSNGELVCKVDLELWQKINKVTAQKPVTRVVFSVKED